MSGDDNCMERIVHIKAAGKVQGVGYRAYVARAARARQVSGWIRNLPDGQVESVFIGEGSAVDELLALVREGPSGSDVDMVTIEDCGPDLLGSPNGFEIR